jgi:hypothetical protein
MPDTVVPPDSFRGAPLPWWGKIVAKLVLSRLPVPHSVWTRFNIFRHSYSSRDPAEQVRAARERVNVFIANTGRVPRTILELGPGEITTCGVVYSAMGVERIIFADTGDFGALDPAAYHEVAQAAREQGLAPPDIADARNRAEIFARCGVEYHTDGLSGLQSLPSRSVDFITSTVVIEHIRRQELEPTFVELQRITAPDGLGCHTIDFHDHLGGKLANLRFSPAVWESNTMSNSGFYTNRVSASHVIALLQRSNFEIEIISRSMWSEPRAGRGQIARELRESWTDEDLRICSMGLVVRPVGGRGHHSAVADLRSRTAFPAKIAAAPGAPHPFSEMYS